MRKLSDGVTVNGTLGPVGLCVYVCQPETAVWCISLQKANRIARVSLVKAAFARPIFGFGFIITVTFKCLSVLAFRPSENYPVMP